MKFILTLFCVILMSSCGINKLGAPFPPSSHLWKKNGYTIRMNEIATVECGLSEVRKGTSQNRTIEEYRRIKKNYQSCMLNKGFKYNCSGWMEFDLDDTFIHDKTCNNDIEK